MQILDFSELLRDQSRGRRIMLFEGTRRHVCWDMVSEHVESCVGICVPTLWVCTLILKSVELFRDRKMPMKDQWFWGGQDVKPVEILESIDPHTVFILRYDRAGVKSLYWWVAPRSERADEGCMFFGGQDVASYCEKIVSKLTGRVRYVHIWTAHWAANVCFYVKSAEEG